MNPGILTPPTQFATLPRRLLGRPTPVPLIGHRTQDFLPDRISGLAFWIDAADRDSVTLDSGRVATINDKSGNGRHASNLTSGSTQPTYFIAGRNGRNVMRFTAASGQRLVAGAVGDWNFLHDGTPSTVYVVCTNTSVTQCVFSTQTSVGDPPTGAGAMVGTITSNRFVSRVANATPASPFATNTPINQYSLNALCIVQVLLDPGNANTFNKGRISANADDVQNTRFATGSPSSGNSEQALWIGRSSVGSPYGGDICELIIYRQALSAVDRQSVRLYLADKWGVPSS